MLHRDDRRRWSDGDLLSAVAARDGAAFGVWSRFHELSARGRNPVSSTPVLEPDLP